MTEITIYRQTIDGSVETIFITPINEGDIYSRQLMSEDYIILKFSLTEPIYFQLGDYCDTDFGRFELVDFYRPSYNISTGGYDYELRLDAEYYKWKNKIFKYRPEYGGQEASWSLTDKIDVFMMVFLANLSAHGYKYKRNADYTVVYEDGIDFSARKPITFSNTNLIDALTTIAEQWECEWWVVNQEIHFGKCQLGTEDDALEFEDGVSVDKMSPSASSDGYFSRLFVFGGTTNIPARYRKQLIFDVKDRTNGIEDTARPLSWSFFSNLLTQNKDPYIFSLPNGYYAGVPVEIAGATEGSHEPGHRFILKFPEPLNVKLTRYSVDNVLREAQVIVRIKALQEDGTTVIKEAETITTWAKRDTNVSTSELKSFSIDIPDFEWEINKGTFCKYKIEVDSKLCGFQFIQDTFPVYRSYLWARIGLRILSGIHAGEKIYITNVYDGVHVSPMEGGPFFTLGTRYEIVNIPDGSQLIRSKVPASYFTQDYTTETTLTGIVEQHLMLPETWNDGKNYIDAKEDLTEEEKVEGVLVLNDIYPQTECEVTSVDYYQTERKDDNTGGGTGIWDTYYLVNDANINLEKDYILPDVNNFSILFTFGKLSGMEFEINILKKGDHLDGNVKLSDGTIGVYEAKGQMFHILANEEYGRKLPDNLLYPEPQDTFIIKGYDPDFLEDLGLVTKAEEELLEKGKEAIQKSNIDPNTYTCPLYWWKAKEYGNLQLGQRVRLVSKAYFPLGDRLSRIIGFTIKLDIPHDTPEYIVGESAPYSRIGELESKLNEITVNGTTYIQAGEYGGSGTLYIIKTGSLAVPSDNNVYSAKRSDKQFLRKDTEDKAEELITFAKGLKAEDLCTFTVGLISVLLAKFKNGADFGEYAEGVSGAIIDANGSAEFENVSSRKLLSSDTAKIREIIDSITFDDIATFVQGLTTRDIYSEDWVSGLKGFGMYHKNSGKSYMEVDELLVRVKAVFNELEIRKLSYAGGNIELSGAGGTIYKVVPQGNLTAAPGNLISDSAFSELNDDMSLNASAELIPKNGYNELHIVEMYASLPSYYGLHYYLTAEPGQDYTISFHYHGDLIEGAVLEIAASLEPEGEVYYKFPFAPDGSNKLELADNDEDTFVSQTITMPNTCSGLIVNIWLRRKGEIFISRPRVEKGDTATDWGVINTSSYRCYLIRDDGTMATRNWWQVGDMAKCQTFNLAQEAHEDFDENGFFETWKNVSNRYYWRAVIAVGEEMLDDGRTYNYVDLANTEWVALPDADGITSSYKGMDTIYEDFDVELHDMVNDAPMAGDAIVQEGNLMDEDRQHIIKLCVIGENAPSIEEYAGVNDYQLAKFRKTMIAPRTGDVFVAKRFEIMTENGGAYRVPCDRGEYTPDMRCYYYDRVSYNGSLWLCISPDGNVRTSDDGTTEYVAPDIMEYDIWQRQVAQGESGKDAVNIVVTGRNVIFKEPGSIKVYVEVYVGDERLTYGSKLDDNGNPIGGWSCGILSDNHYLLDGEVYWDFGTEDNGKRFYYRLASGGDFTSAEIPFTVTVRGVPYQKSIYLSSVKDGEDALTVTLSPETIILSQSLTNNSVSTTSAYTLVKVFKGTVDVSENATVNITTDGTCEVSTPSFQSSYNAWLVRIRSLIGTPKKGVITVSVTYDGATMTRPFTFVVNRLGEFKETIENDVKTQIASKEFSYVDADGTVHTTSGISEIIQSSDAISQRVEKVEDGLLTAQSEIKQNAESISMNVYASDDENYLVFEGSSETVSVLPGGSEQVGISPQFNGTAPTKINFQCVVNTRGLISGIVEFFFAISGTEIYSFTCDVVNTTYLYPIKEEFIINSNFNADNFTLTITNKCNGVVGVTGLRMRKSDSINNGLTKTGIDISKGIIHLQAENTIIDNDVTVGSLITEKTEDGAYIKLSGGEMAVYGRNIKPTIRFGIDEATGNAVLKFYNSKGDFMYNLGPDSFPGLINNSVKDGWNPTEEEGGILSLPFTNGAASNTVFLLILGDLVSPISAAPYFMFCEGYTFNDSNQKIFLHGGRYDGKWYNSTDVNTVHEPTGDTSYEPTGDIIADGTYSCELSGSDYLYPNSKKYPRSVEVTFRRFANGKCVKTLTEKLQITYYYSIVESTVMAASTTGPTQPVEPVNTIPKISEVTPKTITLPDSFYTDN